MFLAEPPRTQYDLHFQIWGFDIRVSPFFWLVVVLLGWQLTVGLDKGLETLYGSSPGQAVLLILWIVAVFLSILIHELGHAVAMRYYGMNAYIVLYHFGGLAVPDRAGSFMSAGRSVGGKENQIIISAAGPAAQLALVAIVGGIIKFSGTSLPYALPLIEDPFGWSGQPPIGSPPLVALALFLLLPSIFWALLNLLPVYPLDGGQIARELMMMYSGDGIKNSLMVSVATGGAIAVLGFMYGQTYLAIMFALLAYSSYQTLQAYHGRGGGFGGGGYGGGPW